MCCLLALQKGRISAAREAYWRGKGILLAWQKRPIGVVKETYQRGNRGLLVWQQRPISVTKEAINAAKEAYQRGKRSSKSKQARPGPGPCQRKCRMCEQMQPPQSLRPSTQIRSRGGCAAE